MLPNVFGLCALAFDIYVRIALSRFEQWCVKSESHLYILCNYLPFSKASKGAQGGPQQHETPEQKHSPTDISKRLQSSENWKCKRAMERGHINAIHVIFLWPEPLRNVSGWVFRGLVLLRTTLCAFIGFGKGKIIAQNVGTKIGLIGHIYFGIFCTGCLVPC